MLSFLTKISFGMDSFLYPRVKSFIEFTQKFISYDPSKIAPHVCSFGVILDTIYEYFFMFHGLSLSLVIGLFLNSFIVYNFRNRFNQTTEMGFFTSRILHLNEVQFVFWIGLILSVIFHRDLKSFNHDTMSGLFFIFSIYFLSYVALCMMEVPPSKKKEKESLFNNFGWQS